MSSGIVAYSHLRRAGSVMADDASAARAGRPPPVAAPTLVRVSPASPAADRTVRLHVVTGKGGTGKTTVAAALALALAADGRTVLLVETEGRQGIAQLFDTAPLPYEERRGAGTPRGGGGQGLGIHIEGRLPEDPGLFYKPRPARPAPP